MAKTKRETNGIKISGRIIAVFAALVLLLLAAAVYIAPKFSSTFKEYRTARSEYKAAKKELSAAESANNDINRILNDKKKAKDESDKLSARAFSAAAALEKDIQDGKSKKKLC